MIGKDEWIQKIKIVGAKDWRIMVLSKCKVCDGKKKKFIKEKEACRLLSSWGINTLFSEIPLLAPLLL